MRANRWVAILREAFIAQLSQPLAAIATMVLVAGMCAAVLLTSGRAEGAQQSVLATIDSQGTRSILVRATPKAGLDSTVISRLKPVKGIESVIAFGSISDVRNELLPDGKRVPLRDFWGDDLRSIGSGEAIASGIALQQLGMEVAAGSVVLDGGSSIAVVGKIETNDMLAEYEPLLLRPRSADDTDKVSLVVVTVSDAALVAAVADTVKPLIGATDPSEVQIHTSEKLATLRGSVQDQLGAFGATLAAGVLTLAGILVAVVGTALVLFKRKDYGRRRALGATRGLIIGLILTQTFTASVAGAALGTVTSLAVLLAFRDPLPSFEYATAVAVLAVGVSIIAGIVPGILAARRDPIKELRVP